ncbi:MAG: PEP-CTERM sorting domain-containing protein [Planctomycetota bacterium]
MKRFDSIGAAAMGLSVGCVLTAGSAWGVVINGGDGSGNTTADTVAFGEAFDAVTTEGVGNAVYLGNGVAIKPFHTAGGASGDGEVFGETVVGAQRLFEPDGSSLTDLEMIRVDVAPNVPALSIVSVAPSVNDTVRLIGSGANREATETMWNITGVGQNATWTETGVPAIADAEGFKPVISSGNTRFGDTRWGTNQVDSFLDFQSNNAGIIDGFRTVFSENGGANEATAVGQDSGGAVVVFNQGSGEWELAGLMHAIQVFDGQPDVPFTAVYGQSTLISDLTLYVDQINIFKSDLNLDRTINTADLAILAGGFGSAGDFTTGDLNADGTVDTADLAILAGVFGESSPGFVPVSSVTDGVAVPEPGTAVLLAAGCLAVVGRRRSGRSA